jgi:glucose/arabinose dehydrogenase
MTQGKLGRRHARRTTTAATLAALAVAAGSHGGGLPDGFVDELFGPDPGLPIGTTFAADGRQFVWHANGTVWEMDADGNLAHDPLVDIREEVGIWADHGLIGFALDPDFTTNGHVYLAYVVDHHHLVHYGTKHYDPTASEYNEATIGRITRYTACADDDFHTVDPESRLVLLGETIGSGPAILHSSHGVGGLAFGHDGSLLASFGDGASWNGVDAGGDGAGAYAVEALAQGIIAPKEDVGAYRAQLVDSLSGKIVRLDPATGDGRPDNPFFDAAAPRSARSRVWALGFRNPFRFAVRPEAAGSPAAHDGPGTLYVGDVGWSSWEELNVVTEGGQNFGWPIFEGLGFNPPYFNESRDNLDAPNPLFGIDGCTQEFVPFRFLIQQATLVPDPQFLNPCNPIVPLPDTLDLFLHARPAIEWGHGVSGPARTGIFVGDDAAIVDVGAPGSPVTGPQFGGHAAIGGVWYDGDAFPEAYRDRYYHADYAPGWVQMVEFDPDDAPVSVTPLISGDLSVVDMAVHPIDGSIHYVVLGQGVRRLSHVGDANRPPDAVATAQPGWGAGPLEVQLRGGGSTDPEGGPLTYAWDFGDGEPGSDEIDPVHVYTAPPGVPTAFTATLVVTDEKGLTDEDTVLVSVNNTPPQIEITSPADGTRYPLDDETVYDLVTTIIDGEHGPADLTCAWQTILHHDYHQHPEPADPACTTTATISPFGCLVGTYWYRITLTVTDAAGLTAYDEVILEPDCNDCPDPNGDGMVDFLDLLVVLTDWGPCPGGCPGDVVPDGVVGLGDVLVVLSRWGPCPILP